jgi:hypothetical protein
LHMDKNIKTLEEYAALTGEAIDDYMRVAWTQAMLKRSQPEKEKAGPQGTAPMRGPQPASNLAESEKKTVKNKSKTYDDLVANLRSMADAKSLLYDPSYHPMNIEEDAQRAIDFVAKYPNEADMVNSGLRFAPAEITEVAIRRASVAMAIATKNDVKLSKYINGLLNTNRLFGRNIVANKGVAIGGNMLNWTGAVQEANVEKWERDHNKGIRKEENKTSYQKFSQDKVADIKDGMQVNVRKRAVKSAEVAAWLKQYMC